MRKTLQRIKEMEFIDDVSDETFGYRSAEDGSDGYWAYTKAGYRFSESGAGLHTAHEYTLKDLLAVVRRGVEPCVCDDCLKHSSS